MMLVIGALLFIVGSVGKVYEEARYNTWMGMFYALAIGFGASALTSALQIKVHFLWMLGFFMVYFLILSLISNWLKNRNSNQLPG